MASRQRHKTAGARPPRTFFSGHRDSGSALDREVQSEPCHEEMVILESSQACSVLHVREKQTVLQVVLSGGYLLPHHNPVRPD